MRSTIRALCVLIALTSPTAFAGDKCFGAVGQQCGMFSGGPLASVAFCSPWNFNPATTFCEVSGGSWTHDSCCADNPNGRWCDGLGSAFNEGCVTAWNRALSRFGWGYHWVRLVDGTRQDNDGNVNRSEYCAANGSGVHKSDTQYCCSNSYRLPTWFEWIGRPSLRICRS